MMWITFICGVDEFLPFAELLEDLFCRVDTPTHGLLSRVVIELNLKSYEKVFFLAQNT